MRCCITEAGLQRGGMVLTGAAALQVWLARELATYRPITNLSSDWRDGIAFCGLVHR